MGLKTKRNHMIISTTAEKYFDKIQHDFLINALDGIGLKRTDFSKIKSIYDTQRQHYSKLRKSQSNPIKMQNEIMLSTIPTPFQQILKALAGPIRLEKEIKGYKQEKKESNYPYLQMIQHIYANTCEIYIYIYEIIKLPPENFQTINNFIRVAKYLINLQKCIASLPSPRNTLQKRSWL